MLFLLNKNLFVHRFVRKAWKIRMMIGRLSNFLREWKTVGGYANTQITFMATTANLVSSGGWRGCSSGGR